MSQGTVFGNFKETNKVMIELDVRTEGQWRSRVNSQFSKSIHNGPKKRSVVNFLEYKKGWYDFQFIDTFWLNNDCWK